MKNEVNLNPDAVKEVHSIPRQQAGDAWGKLDGEPIENSRPSAPEWTRYMDSRRKEFCKG